MRTLSLLLVLLTVGAVQRVALADPCPADETPAPALCATPDDRPPAGPWGHGPPPGQPREAEDPKGGERRRGPRDRVPGIFRDVTDAQVEEILAFMQKYMPWRTDALEQLRQSDPDRFRMLCRRLRFEVSQLEHLQQRDEKAFRMAIEDRQLRMRTWELAARIRDTKDAKEKGKLTRELRQALDRMFDLETVTREAHIRSLEERIGSLRKDLEHRSQHRKEIVDQRLREALEGKQELRPPDRGERFPRRREGSRDEEPPPGSPPPKGPPPAP